MINDIKSNNSQEDIKKKIIKKEKVKNTQKHIHGAKKSKQNVFKLSDSWIFEYFFSIDRKKKSIQIIFSVIYLVIICLASLTTVISLVVPIDEKIKLDISLMPYYYFVISLFTFDWLIRSYYSKWTVSSGKKTFIKYLLYQFRASNILDLLSWIIPLILIFYYPVDNPYFVLIPTFLILKTFTIFRLFEIINKNENLKVLLFVFKRSIKLILIVVLSMIVLDLIFAIFIFNFELITPPLIPGEVPKISTYFDSVWFCFITITTIGYGDIYPVTATGRIITIILAILGIGFYSFLTSIIVNSFTKYLDELKKKKEKNNMNSQKFLLDEYKKEIYKKIDLISKKDKLIQNNEITTINIKKDESINESLNPLSNLKIENISNASKNKEIIEDKNILDINQKIENKPKIEKLDVEKKENILDINQKIENNPKIENGNINDKENENVNSGNGNKKDKK